MAYHRYIEIKDKKIKSEDIEQHLEDINNNFFSGLLKITKYKDKEYIVEYDDEYFVSIDINDDVIIFRFNLKYRMNEIITQIFSQYIAEKIAKYDVFEMTYEKILFDEIENEYVNIYDPESIGRYINYIIYDLCIINDDIREFYKKVKKNKLINKIKVFLNLY